MSTTAKSNATTRRKPVQSAQERPAAQVVQFPLFAPKPRQTAPQEVQVVICECSADAVRVRLLPDPAADQVSIDPVHKRAKNPNDPPTVAGYRLHSALTVDKLLRAEDGHIIGVQLLQGERKVVWQAE